MIVILGAIYWTKVEDGLSITEAFTSLSIISLATAPLMTMVVALSQIAGVFGCFGRIQAYLLLENQEDVRVIAEFGADDSSKTLKKKPRSNQPQDLDPVHGSKLTADTSKPAVIISTATFKSGDETKLLHDIDISIPQGVTTMVVGRVGCGKSSLLKAITGELVPSAGSIEATTTSMAFCEQTPWLQNTTIRGNIVCDSALDEKWLATVIHACSLNQDIAMFPAGDATVVGSGGIALSGGQKQRMVSCYWQVLS